MYSIDEQGWLQPARHCPSPNFNARPPGEAISLLVIHNISLPPGEFGGPQIRQLFCNELDCLADPRLEELEGLRVSSHLLIDRLGETTQFVSFLDRAWHAGQSHFEGRDNCNDFSIGIELEGTDDQTYTPAQYRELIVVTRTLQCYYPDICSARITGHSDIAPGRKTDPGPAFDWAHYKQALG